MDRRFPILSGAASDLIGCLLALLLLIMGAVLLLVIPAFNSVVLGILIFGAVIGMAYGVVKIPHWISESYALVDEEGVLVRTRFSSQRIPHEEIAYVSHRLPGEEKNCYHVKIGLVSGETLEIATFNETAPESGSPLPVSLDRDPVGASLTLTIRDLRSGCLRRAKGEALPPPSNHKDKRAEIDTKKAPEQSLRDALVEALREVDLLRKKRGGFSTQTAAREFRSSNAAIARLRAERIVVGVDGVLLTRRFRFIPHADIEGVYHQKRGRRGYVVLGAALEWVVSLRLRNGEVLDLGARWVRESSEDQWGAELARAIEAAHEAWSVAKGGARSEEELLARGERTGAEWLQGLRELLRGNVTAYRAGLLHNQDLSKLLDDAGASPSTRAAAAVALAASGDKTTAPRLRIAAESMADPRVHVLLEKVADASDEAAVIEALDALEDEKRRNRA